MFGVLGSITFWAIFFSVGFIIGSVMLKHVAPVTWEGITMGKRPMSREFTTLKADWIWMILAAITVYLFWPIILVFCILGFLIKKVLWPLFRKTVLASNQIIPNIKIKTKKE